MESAGMRLPARSSIPLDNNTLQNSQASLPPIDEIRNGLFFGSVRRPIFAGRRLLIESRSCEPKTGAKTVNVTNG